MFPAYEMVYGAELEYRREQLMALRRPRRPRRTRRTRRPTAGWSRAVWTDHSPRPA